MKNSIKKELEEHIVDLISDGVLTNDNKEEHHFHAFNEDYYIIGYHQASEWLKKHGIGELEAAAICTQYEIDNFGAVGEPYEDSERVANMLAYIYGEQLLESIRYDTVEELKEAILD